ncbi:MAG: helix-turn-helix domain-containing protein [Streptosporangiales bacterium]|nr:helix-turn-helix domain-containing protein [Streptosporangiales bacterium]
MPTGPTTSTKGILQPKQAAEHIDLRRYPAAPDVGRFVERYWAVHWSLGPGESYAVRLISHPCVNVTFLDGVGAQVHGVGTTTSTHPLSGSGSVFGVKFRPGGFRAFADRPVAALTDRSLPMRELFGPAADGLAATVAEIDTDGRRVEVVEVVEEFLRRRLPAAADATYLRLTEMAAVMLEDRSITRVGHVADRFGMSVRSLQRVFHKYVGVGPKWMIRRYRLHDGAELLATDKSADVASLAVQLGWFDQAHFTRDFRAHVGASPVEYAMACAAAEDRKPLALLGS